MIATIGDERTANAAASELPDGILEMGTTADVDAHKDGTMVFSARLAKGRYLLVSRAGGNTAESRCSSPERTAEFTVK